jgi:hypothetical protein
MEMKVIPHGYAVGDEVSYGFNGDWYPDGKVEKITKKFLITTGGKKYSLFNYSARELIKDANGKTVDCEDVIKEGFRSVNGGTWTLAKGVIRETNPEF